jgi:putative ATP-dependent endonuclease of OLD family
MNILIDKIRIKNFRALQNVEIELKPITVLVGANNAGKTTLLRALNSVLGVSRPLLNKDDLFIDQNGVSHESTIVIDLHIIPVAQDGRRENQFDTPWTSALGGSDFIQQDAQGREFFAFRSSFQFEKEDTPSLVDYDLITDWDAQIVGMKLTRMRQIRESLKMYFIDAQRDLHQDAGLRTSFFGRMVAQLEHGYSKEALDEIKALIEQANNKAIDGSTVLKHLSEKLALLNTATQTSGKGVSINPLPKNIRDLHKGMKVDFQDNGSDSFGMEYHGMGTRSWASILTAGAFIDWDLQRIQGKIENGEDTSLLFPIVAIEEPEAHLHPNAQRTLYGQLKGFNGQKIISTHSPYIAGQADLSELRHFYKLKDNVEVTQLFFRVEEDEKIRGLNKKIEDASGTPNEKNEFNMELMQLESAAKGKISLEGIRKLKKEITEKRGELLFSKVIVLFEGETELISLPVFGRCYFKGRYPHELGVTFVDVGGKLNYEPFLNIAKFLNIPTFILSDADGDTVKKVKTQITNVFETINVVELVSLDPGADFEQCIADCGYDHLINEAIDKVEGKEKYIESYIERLNGHKKKGGVTRVYDDETGLKQALLDCMGENKTQYAAEIAEQFVSFDVIPSKIKELFSKIDQLLNPTKENDNEP